MKIVQCTPLFLPSEGGTQRAVFYLSKELLKLGHDVSVFTYNALDDCAIGPLCSSGLKSYEQIDGIEVRRFRYSSLTPGLCFSKAFSLSLLKLLVKGKVDIVHFQGFFNLPDIVINSMWGKVNGVPLCLTTHGLQEALSEFHRAHNGLMKILAEKTIKSVLASVDNFITLSRTDSSVLIDLGLKSSKIHYVPNGVDLTKFTNCRLAREVSQKYDILSSRRVILCVCRVSKNKGIHNLIEAASELRNDIDGSLVLVVGPTADRSYKNSLRDLISKLGISDTVSFMEGVTDNELADLYSRADVFVLPSEKETFPLVILEAMAAGCPVIATSVGAIPEIVKNKDNGLLIRPNDVKEIVEAVRLLLCDDDLRRRIASQGKKTVQDYSWDKIAKKTLHIYSKCLAK